MEYQIYDPSFSTDQKETVSIPTTDEPRKSIESINDNLEVIEFLKLNQSRNHYLGYLRGNCFKYLYITQSTSQQQQLSNYKKLLFYSKQLVDLFSKK